jgi:Fur family transcriptional regulator, peroxide stress response regulator
MGTRATIEYLMECLEAAGKRSTPQRYAICKALVEHGGHPTVAEMYDRVRSEFPMISQATVYNTVDTLRDLGLLRPLESVYHEHTHYDLDPSPHINLICTHCSNIVDIHIAELDALLVQLAQRSAYQIERGAGLLAYGVCPACSEE